MSKKLSQGNNNENEIQFYLVFSPIGQYTCSKPSGLEYIYYPINYTKDKKYLLGRQIKNCLLKNFNAHRDNELITGELITGVRTFKFKHIINICVYENSSIINTNFEKKIYN